MRATCVCVGALAVLVGLSLGFSAATFVDWGKEAKWWDLMTAYGTAGAALAAVAVPLYQNWDRRREREREKAFEAFAAAGGLSRTSHSLMQMADAWKNGRRLPPAGSLANIVGRLTEAQRQSSDTVRGLIVGRLLSYAIEMQSVVEAVLAAEPGDLVNTISKAHLQTKLYWTNHPDTLEELQRLAASTKLLEDQAVERCKRLGFTDRDLVGM